MPRALYRMARGSGKRGNQDPIVLTAKKSKQTSHQIRDYVLCRACEQRFSIHGEDYTMTLVTKRDGQFPLLEMLNAIAPTQNSVKSKVYSAAHTPTLDRAKIAYFALSIFWRASIHTWKEESGERVTIELGKKYNEELRRHLLGEAPVPAHAFLMVAVCTDVESQKTFFVPNENTKVKDRSVGMEVRGLHFQFRVTKTPAPWQRRLSMINNPSGWISVWDCLERGVWRLGDGKAG
jgi:hypothetical protein